MSNIQPYSYPDSQNAPMQPPLNGLPIDMNAKLARHEPHALLDIANLEQDLTQIMSGGKAPLRAEVLAIFKMHFTQALDHARQRFENGRLGGLEMARLIAAIHEDLIKTLFSFTQNHILGAQNLTKGERLALCAVGGFGRGEMAPQSDVDLLFILPDKKASAYAESLIEYMLYMLWDLGLKVGHAARSLEQSIKLAKTDNTILTALLDMRHLCGAQALSEALQSQFRKDITRGTGRKYIAHKLEERDSRHAREGHSRYVIEPNIKEGKGGLRDLHVLYWIAKFLDKDGRITDPQRASDYVDMGLFNENAALRFVRAADFLWRTRIWLHYLSGRATETLSFDMQVLIARKMGQASGEVEQAVARFMREYFTNAKGVGALTRIACAKLEAQKAILLPKGLDALLPGSRKNLKNTALILDHGRLSFADPLQLKQDPSLILQLFETAGRRNIDIHPNAFSELDYRRNLIDANFRRDPKNSVLFQKTLMNAKAPYATLRIMNEAGVLGRYLMEFGSIVGRTQFNMHHAYTVDEHSLRLVDNFDDIRKGRLEAEHPIATKIAQDFTDEQVLIMMLTCLLHDTGKGKGDQSIEGAQLTRRACKRLGLSADIIDMAAWLVRRHLDMSETAQRRDISDPETIAKFAALIGSQKHLDMLFILTIIDIRSVGPGIWNDWKGVLLRELYAASTAYLDGREELAPTARASALKEEIFDKLPMDKARRVEKIAGGLPQSYWLNFNRADLLRHMRFFDGVIQNADSDTDLTNDDDAGVDRDAKLAKPIFYSAVQSWFNRSRDITELWVLAKDRSGLFADLTKALASCGASISGAQLHTAQSGQVMNVFYLHGGDGRAFGQGSEHQIETLRRRALRAARGEPQDIIIPKDLPSRRSGAIPVKPQVKFLDHASNQQSIVEIQGRDRAGLLYQIAHIFDEEGLDVKSAHIEVVGTQAIDAFYVRDRASDSLLSPAMQARLQQKLFAILDNNNDNNYDSPKRGALPKPASTDALVDKV